MIININTEFIQLKHLIYNLNTIKYKNIYKFINDF